MKSYLRSVVLVAAVVALSTAGFSADGSSLKPPAGAKVAIVMFEDLECPDCARAYPVVWEVAKAHNIPVVLHDFPLPKHPWSFDAAVYARFFDSRSEKLGNDFRGYVFKNQINISRENLRQFVQKFADDNKVPLPFAVDPDGQLKALVQADYQLGRQIGLQQTPTIFVIGNGGPSTPAVEVIDRSQLSPIVEEMLRKAGPASPARPATRTRKKGS
jgi:protein-disulfide isomerase